MQEELEQRSVTLIVSTSKFTGRTLKSAISHFLSYTKHKVQEHKQEKKAVVPHGKQSVKDLVGQDAGVVLRWSCHPLVYEFAIRGEPERQKL